MRNYLCSTLAGIFFLTGCASRQAQSLADSADEWGEGKQQQDGSTVYKRTFEVPASHWKPNDVTNYFADLEYTKLHIAEANGGKYMHVLLSAEDTSEWDIKNEARREMTVRRDDKKRISQMSLSLGNFHYIDLDGDGKLDLFFDHVSHQSFIMTKDKLLRVAPKRTKDQDVQVSLEGKVAFKFQNGEWVQQGTR
ncbi:MAG: hypothetical protein FVQ82_06005 [Planctomycetes bacterium]|nr:hypothetical protein [Planctomycetota bacterium]